MRTTQLLALLIVAAPLPAAAQDAATPPAGDTEVASTVIENYRRRTVVVYGDDPCPVAQSPDEIVVCARRPEEERYRLKTVEPVPGERIEQGGANRVLGLDDVRVAGGTGSCSTVGPGGVTGCGPGINLLGLGAWLNSLITD